MSIQLYPSIAKIKRNGVYENLPGFVPETGSIATQQMIATSESSATAQYVHNKGEYFRLNDTLYQAIVKINVGDSIVVGTNCEVAVLGNDVTHIANSIAEYELGIATSPHNKGEYFMVGEVLYVATIDIQVGDSLSTSTNCIPAVVGDELSKIKTDFVSKDGINEVTPQNLQIVDAVISPNLWNPDTTEYGYYNKDGVFSENSSYLASDFIAVEAGSKYVLTRTYQGNRGTGEMRFVTCYNAGKQVISSAGSNTQVSQPYTIPTGVYFVKISTYYTSSYSDWQFEKAETPTEYKPYGLLSAVIKEQYIPDANMGKIPAFELVDGQNLFNRNDPDFVSGKYIRKDGTLNDNSAYVTTGYIGVEPGDTIVASYLALSGNTYGATLYGIAAYNSEKTVISNSGVSAGNQGTYLVPENIHYLRVSIREGSFTQYLQIEKNHSGNTMWKPYKPYEAPHYELKESYMFPLPNAPENVYLPSDVYVAVGRTIELYNSQVVLDYEKYHFQWKCAKGNAYKRKFSITGDTAGNQNLDLYLYDDKKNLCWVGRCVIHIVAASNPEKKIMPIGDSLTNWKAWLQETMLLSENNIEWVGTRYSGASVDSEGNTYASGTIHHEGRSGFSASDYLTNSTYTFDDRYDGVDTVEASANPFWDGTKFSLSHYLSVQTGVNTPDAVQIFLGTNDIRSGIEPATTNIVAMVESIRTEYPTMKIFICNTIYNANQNGYGSVGSDAYVAQTGANAWQYEQDILVMNLMKSLKTALASFTNVYIIPLATCMDREYDFGQVMTKVNPRSTVEVAMPVERIHPQAPGYYQMADLMYSTYCGVLS